MIVFTSQPQSVVVTEGTNVTFHCSFSGSQGIPDWKINNSVYYWQGIPWPYIFNQRDYSLSINNVQASLNNTTFGCIVHGSIESSVGLLTVVKHEDAHSTISRNYIMYLSSHGQNSHSTGIMSCLLYDNVLILDLV